MAETRTGKSAFVRGMLDGIPIGLGYLAVSFALGITAAEVGLSAAQGFFFSLFGLASAGEYAALTVMMANSGYLQMVLITLVTNARYFLMSCALNQRLNPDLPLRHRFLLGYGITDELFGIAIAQPAPLTPAYSYGSYLVSAPCWALGTALGIIAGNILPVRAVSALGVALFGMFIAVIIPPAKQDKVVLGAVLASFAASFAFAIAPVVSGLSAGMRTIILTIVISAIAAMLFPRADGDDGGATDEVDGEAHDVV